MGLGTLTLDCLEYPEAAFLTPKQARTKRLAKLSITRKQRRDANRRLPIDVADELAEPSDAGYGLGTLHQLEDEPVIVESPDAGTIAWTFGAEPAPDGWDAYLADPSDTTDDEDDAWWAPAGLDDVYAELDDLNDRIAGAGIYADHLYGDTLELAGDTEEFIANDGFIITRGDFYRRGEPTQRAPKQTAGRADVADVRDAIRRSKHHA